MSFASALVAPAPASEELELFAPFIGSWRVRNSLYSEATREWTKTELDWSFSWIIGGRGVQDVLADDDGEAIGTTVRTWDARVGWRVVWFCPRAAEHVVLSAEADGDDIRLQGVQADGRMVTWMFHDITTESFEWDGWCSNDGGDTWWHEQHMDAHLLER
ncbi:MAG: hypothetical protein ABWY03_01015 [Microbacterium sp.]